jgi:hypothetical protein
MDNNKRLGIFIVVVAGVLLIAMAIYTYIFNENQKKANQAANTAPAPNPNALIEKAKQNQPAPTFSFSTTTEASRAWNAEDIKKVAMDFGARFGSYSNQAKYDNFTDLEPEMTASMVQWTDGYVAQLKQKDKNPAVYDGITTTAVAATVKKFDDAGGKAEVLIATMRRQTQGTKATNFNQDLLLDLLKVNGAWKFDAAYWQK